MEPNTKLFRTLCYAPAELAPRISDLVRLGRDADGGYLLPRAVLEEANGCLSLGLGVEWSFEKAFFELKKDSISPDSIVFYDASISIFGIIKSLVYMARRTFYEIRIKKPRSERKFTLVDLQRSLIGLVTYLPAFKIGKNRFTHIRKFVVGIPNKKNECSLSEALNYRKDPKNTIVKIDIEGGEWDILRDKKDMDLLTDTPVLIMEIHDTRKQEFKDLLLLLKTNFWIAHIHGNTSGRGTAFGMPLYLEITFVNKRYSRGTGIRKRLPIDGLDFPGRPGEPPYEFEFSNS